MPRFALLRHHSPRGRHWDLLLEIGPMLRTWELAEWPRPGREMVCRELPDHRPMYLDYEGPISGGRGNVVREEGGTFELISATEQELLVQLHGRRLVGRLLLCRLPEKEEQWRLRLETQDD